MLYYTETPASGSNSNRATTEGLRAWQRDWILHYHHPEPNEVCQQEENRIPDPDHRFQESIRLSFTQFHR